MIKLKNENKQKSFCDIKIKNSIYIGSCIRIKNSKKIFQVLGINKNQSLCWIREWPINNRGYETFALSTNKIIFSSFCPTSNENLN